MPQDSATWYVLIGEQETGPLTRVELGVELASGAILSDSLVWKEGMANWLPGVRIPELEALFKNPPRSPRAAAARPPPPPSKKQDKGLGLSDFDTSHFRLADLKAEEGAATRQMEFDTSHFRLADLQAEEGAATRQLEFDTSHFRLADLKGAQGARALVPKRIVPKGMEAAGRAAAVRLQSGEGQAAQRAQAGLDGGGEAPGRGAGRGPPGFGGRRDFCAPAGRVGLRSQRHRGGLPEPGRVGPPTGGGAVALRDRAGPHEAKVIEEPAAGPHADALSAWAAKELQTSAAAEQKGDLAAMLKAKARAASPPPVPRAEGKSWLPTAVAIAGALALAVALLWVLLAD